MSLLSIINGKEGQLVRRLGRELVRQDDRVAVFLEGSSSLCLHRAGTNINQPMHSFTYIYTPKGNQFTVPAPASKSRTVSDVDMIVVRSIWHRSALRARTIPRRSTRYRKTKAQMVELAHQAHRTNLPSLLLYTQVLWTEYLSKYLPGRIVWARATE